LLRALGEGDGDMKSSEPVELDVSLLAGARKLQDYQTYHMHRFSLGLSNRLEDGKLEHLNDSLGQGQAGVTTFFNNAPSMPDGHPGKAFQRSILNTTAAVFQSRAETNYHKFLCSQVIRVIDRYQYGNVEAEE
jgi:hypothetical protein